MASENQKCVGVVFSDRAYKDIQTETYDKDPVETGGILLGHVLSTGHWVVVEVIPPGNNSTHQYAYFEYDEHFVNRVADPVANKYEQKLELLGLWHRHPGSMDFFSGTDDGTNIKFAEINPAYGAISGLVNIDPEFRVTMYHVDSPLDYTKVETFVGDDIIPAELLKLKEGVTFEDIDAIKKPKTRSEQQPVAPQQTTRQTTQQPRQTTPNREEPRRTTQNRENHEKPQVVIQRPETGTDFFKKLILGHPKAFFALVGFMAVFVCLIGLYVVGKGVGDKEYDKEIKPIWEEYEEAVKTGKLKSGDLEIYISKLQGLNLKSKVNEGKRKEKEDIIKAKKKELGDKEQEEAKRLLKEEEEKTKQKEAEAKTEAEKTKQKEAEAKTEAEKTKQKEVDLKKIGQTTPQNQESAEPRLGESTTDNKSEVPDADAAPAEPEEKTEEVGSKPKAPAAGDPPASKETKNLVEKSPDAKCKELLEQEKPYKDAEQVYNKLKNGTSLQKSVLKNNLKALANLLENSKFKECKIQISSLRNKIDPQKLSDALKKAMESQLCDQNEAYTVLSHIQNNDPKHTKVHEDYKKICNLEKEDN